MPTTTDEQRTPFARRLFYLFFGVALLAALAFLWKEETGEDASFIAPVFAFFLGLSVLALAVAGVQSGWIRVRHHKAHREENPIVFWAAVGILSAVGVTMVIAGVVMLFGTI